MSIFICGVHTLVTSQFQFPIFGERFWIGHRMSISREVMRTASSFVGVIAADGGCDLIYTSKKRWQQDRHLFLSLDRNLFTISKLLWLHTSSATFQLVLPNTFQVSFRAYLYRVSKVGYLFSFLNLIK